MAFCHGVYTPHGLIVVKYRASVREATMQLRMRTEGNLVTDDSQRPFVLNICF